MGVKLRKINNADGTTSLMLDIWHNGKRQREFLTQLKLSKPLSQLDRQHNKERLKLAEQIRNKREQQIQSDDYEVTPEFRKGVDFLEYFQKFLSKYNKKDKRVILACYNRFKEYVIEENIKDLTTKNVSPKIVIEFKYFLEDNLNGETPANYFKKFKKVLASGVKEKILSTDVSALLASKDKELSIKRNSGLSKEILSFEEIQILARIEAGNENVKKAFLFCCLTGLRFCDITQLKWKNIQKGVLKINQQKTKVDVTINLNQSALSLIGKKDKADDLVFDLPSHTACNKILKTWCKNADIDKHITWHCARHSFGTALVFYGSDVKNASSLLGHSSLAYTDRYVREANKLKEDAVNRLPEITF